MKYGKRQLILASLVLALGAAVYLNWQFAGTKVQSAGDVSEESASSALGAAQLVNNAYVETGFRKTFGRPLDAPDRTG